MTTEDRKEIVFIIMERYCWAEVGSVLKNPSQDELDKFRIYIKIKLAYLTDDKIINVDSIYIERELMSYCKEKNIETIER